MPTSTKLRGVDSILKPTISNILKTNLISFFDWGFINAGGFFNVRLSDTTAYGGDRSQLTRFDSPYYTDGQVWQSFTDPWVWQSGLETSTQPIKVSGVYVDNTFYPLNTVGSFAHTIDYVRGRVIFDSAISTGSTVEVEYSYPWIKVIDAKNVPLLRETQFRHNRIDEGFSNVGSGEWDTFAETRLQLPTVAVSTSTRDYQPYQLGLGQWANTDVLFHVFGEDGDSVEHIADQISFQSQKTIFLFDVDDVSQQNRWPLTFDGAIASGALTYPQMVQVKSAGGFRWRKLWFAEARIEETQRLHSNLYRNTVRMKTRVVLTDI